MKIGVLGTGNIAQTIAVDMKAKGHEVRLFAPEYLMYRIRLLAATREIECRGAFETRQTLDLVTSTVLASTYGIGMALAAPVLFVWQGSIYCLALLLGNFMTTDMMTEISVVGGFLIASSGLSILGIKNCKTLNMLPCLFVPVIWFIILSLF